MRGVTQGHGRILNRTDGGWNNPWKLAGGGRGAGKGAAIGGLVGAGGGTLYGLNENKQHDARYRDAYGACMRSHGYVA